MTQIVLKVLLNSNQPTFDNH